VRIPLIDSPAPSAHHMIICLTVRGATAVRLVTLTKAGVVRVGDVLAYKRTFATSQVIEKDCIVRHGALLSPLD